MYDAQPSAYSLRHMGLPEGVVANAPYVGKAPSVHNAVPLHVVRDWGPSQTGAVGVCLSASALQKELVALELKMPRIRWADYNGSLPDSQESAGSIRFGPHADYGALHHRCSPPTKIYAIWPSLRHAAYLGLSAADLYAITRGRLQLTLKDIYWAYEDRRKAQRVVDQLYLGPMTAARDLGFLQAAGITLLVSVRDTRQAKIGLLNVDRVAAELALETQYVDIFEDRRPDLIRVLRDVLQGINRHLLQHSTTTTTTTTMTTTTGSPPRVLVFCEGGTDRSAIIVAAYLMAVYDLSVAEALCFLHLRRFCIIINDDVIHLLQNFYDIMRAHHDVDRSSRNSIPLLHGTEMAPEEAAWTAMTLQSPEPAPEARPPEVPRAVATGADIRDEDPWQTALQPASRPKRRIEETLDDKDDDRMEGTGDGLMALGESPRRPCGLNLDQGRFVDRRPFAPFTDAGGMETPM